MRITCKKSTKRSIRTVAEASPNWAFVLSTGLLASVLGCGNSKVSNRADGGGDAGDGATRAAQKLLILHTNDIHSHFMGQAPERDYTPGSTNDDATTGGLARMATAIGAARTAAANDGTPVLLLDGGDFMMGTLFEFLGVTQAAELQFLQNAGYDATTIGNHELDWTPRGLAGILSSAVKAGVTVPILSSNMGFSDTSPADDDLKALFDANVIRPKLVKMVGDLKVGFFGLLGADAVQVTPQAAPLAFEAIATAAARMVTELREEDKVDLVIALSHSGINGSGKGEDATLAAAVPGIDIIISGHTHDKLLQPALVGSTLIVTAGSYGRNLGHLQVSVTPAATAGGIANVVVDDYQMQNIDDTILGDEATQTQINALIAGLDTQLAAANLSYKTVVARTTTDLTSVPHVESTLGNLVTDAYRLIGSALQPSDPPLIGAEANGSLRASILKGTTGDIWFADLFRVTPLGIGPNQVPGFPLVTFYLSPKDISSGLELGAAPELIDDQYFLQLSGVKVEYDMTKPPFGRVSSLKLVTGSTEQELDRTNTTQCYKVITTNYVAGLLGVVAAFTNGALSVTAKDKTCATMVDGIMVDATTRYVDANPTTPAVDELKQWQAILTYVKGFPAVAGVPTVPASYAATQGRITKK